MHLKKLRRIAASAICLLLTISSSYSQNEDLAKKIQNPIASLISVPFQNNTETGFGPYDRTSNILNIQPVIPFTLSEKVTLITRTIIPIRTVPIGQSDSKSGLGDINLSLFLTPTKPHKVIWGVGLASGLPTATSTVLGSQKWSAGPSVVALVQPGTWTIGALAQNTWSFAGNSSAADLNFFYSQVFVVKGLKKGWYVNSAPIITANWEASKGDVWTVPVGAGFGKLFTIGKLPINAQVGYYYFAEKPNNYSNSQYRAQVVFLFPK